MAGHSFLWIVVIVLVFLVIYFACRGIRNPGLLDKIQDFFKREISYTPVRDIPVQHQLQPPKTVAVCTAEVHHDDPLLVTLFCKDVESLPEGVSREEFDNLVSQYHQAHLAEKQLIIPRSLNFNYQQYDAEQEQIARETRLQSRQFINRNEVGGLTDQIVATNVKVGGNLGVRQFNKKSR